MLKYIRNTRLSSQKFDYLNENIKLILSLQKHDVMDDFQTIQENIFVDSK